MAVVIQQQNLRKQAGYYSRITGGNSDVIYVDFGAAVANRMPYPLFYYTAAWQCAATGGAVAVAYAFRPDYDKSTAGHWEDHETHASVASGMTELDTENSPIGALRFTTGSNATMVVEVWSPSEVDIS